jgi:hypothetical protein
VETEEETGEEEEVVIEEEVAVEAEEDVEVEEDHQEVDLKSSSNHTDYQVSILQEDPKIQWLLKILSLDKVCTTKSVLAFKLMERKSNIEYGILSVLKLQHLFWVVFPKQV